MRRERDFYETASWQVDALVDHLPEIKGSIWCPTVGDGSLLARLRERRPDLGPFVTNDIDQTKEADHYLDATDPDAWTELYELHGRPDWVIDNFPFNVEFRIVKHAFIWARSGVVAMARLSFSEGTRVRGPWLSRHPRQKQIVLERYSFTGNGKSDSATTEWLVWAHGPIANPGVVTTFGYKDGSVQKKSVSMEAEAVS